jgi:hypothetical protein
MKIIQILAVREEEEEEEEQREQSGRVPRFFAIVFPTPSSPLFRSIPASSLPLS